MNEDIFIVNNTMQDLSFMRKELIESARQGVLIPALADVAEDMLVIKFMREGEKIKIIVDLA